jgi:hypothetical protein
LRIVLGDGQQPAQRGGERGVPTSSASPWSVYR